MPTTESDRLEMHLKLRDVLGDKVAEIVMQHLPPAGWTDIARQSEMVARFDAVDARFDAIDTRFDAIDTRFAALESRLGGVITGVWAMGSILSASMVALFTVIATKL